MVTAMEYFLHLAIFICLYTSLAQSLNLAAGIAGLISLAHAGFYGIGAYTTAMPTVHFGFFWLNLPIAILISGAVALSVSVVGLRTVEDYFIIGTLAMQVIVFSEMNNWIDLTRGPLGIPGILAIQLFGFDSKILFLLRSVFLPQSSGAY